MNFLIILGILTRLLPHPANMTAIGTISFLAGSQSDKKLHWAIPMIAMFSSDLIMGLIHPDWMIFSAVTPWVYLSTILYAKIGWFSFQKEKQYTRMKAYGRCLIFLLVGSTQFYLITNTAVWINGLGYSKNLDGLWASLIAGLPFYRNTAIADVAFFSVVIWVGMGVLALAKGTPYEAKQVS